MLLNADPMSQPLVFSLDKHRFCKGWASIVHDLKMPPDSMHGTKILLEEIFQFPDMLGSTESTIYRHKDAKVHLLSALLSGVCHTG